VTTASERSGETGAAPAKRARGRGTALARLIVSESTRSFVLNRNLESSATLAYYGFLSLMPLLLLAIYVLGSVLRLAGDVEGGLAEAVRGIFPTFSDAMLKDLTALATSRVWGFVSVVVLLWSITPFAAAARSAMLRVFKAERRLHFVKAKLLDLSAVLMLLAAFVVMVAVKAALPGLRAGGGLRFAGFIVPFAIAGAVLAFFYAVFSPVRLRRNEVLLGAAAAAALLFVMRPLFGLVLQFNPQYGYAFGSLKAIFLLIVWVYYTFAVILFGAELMANLRRKEALVLRGFLEGSPAARGAALRLLEEFVDRADAGEVLFREGDEGRDMYYVLSGSIDLSREGRRLRTMREGDYFGEMSMLIHTARTATAVAAEETRLVRISETNLETILRENPGIVRGILREMAERLKATSEQLAARDGKAAG
jgi:membrane protein